MEAKLISLGTERFVLKSGRVMLPIVLESLSSSECDKSVEKIPEKLFDLDAFVGESDFCSSYHLPKEDIIVTAAVEVK